MPSPAEWSNDLASEAKELAAVNAAVMKQHMDTDQLQFDAISKQLDEATTARHALRNDMLGGMGEVRANITDNARELRTSIATITQTVNNRFWTMAMAVIGVLLTVVGSLIVSLAYFVFGKAGGG